MSKNQPNQFPTITKKLGKYAGEWVGFAGKKLVAHDRDARVVYRKIKALYPDAEPYIFKVPDRRFYLFCGQVRKGRPVGRVTGPDPLEVWLANPIRGVWSDSSGVDDSLN